MHVKLSSTITAAKTSCEKSKSNKSISLQTQILFWKGGEGEEEEKRKRNPDFWNAAWTSYDHCTYPAHLDEMYVKIISYRRKYNYLSFPSSPLQFPV